MPFLPQNNNVTTEGKERKRNQLKHHRWLNCYRKYDGLVWINQPLSSFLPHNSGIIYICVFVFAFCGFTRLSFRIWLHFAVWYLLKLLSGKRRVLRVYKSKSHLWRRAAAASPFHDRNVVTYLEFFLHLWFTFCLNMNRSQLTIRTTAMMKHNKATTSYQSAKRITTRCV